MFYSTPILHHPDPKILFIVEGDASDMGAGAMLSQRDPIDNKVCTPLCLFLSKHFSISEQNYDVGHQELLAIKMALKEWMQWLEEDNISFMIWMEHKNLTRLQEAKWLNPRQARWALLCYPQ